MTLAATHPAPSPADLRPTATSRVLRAGRRPSERLPHPSWRAATGLAAAPSARRSAPLPSSLSPSAQDFWDRLGL